MPSLDVKWIVALLGLLFLVLAAGQRREGRLTPRGRAWLRVGLLFCAVAAWLWWPR